LIDVQPRRSATVFARVRLARHVAVRRCRIRAAGHEGAITAYDIAAVALLAILDAGGRKPRGRTGRGAGLHADIGGRDGVLLRGKGSRARRALAVAAEVVPAGGGGGVCQREIGDCDGLGGRCRRSVLWVGEDGEPVGPSAVFGR
jgi:hypothetical protein